MQGSEVHELGQMLRQARERKGMTLADAQQATKIRQSFLQALENEDYTVLPPPFYIRGFIKTYASCLGLDPRNAVMLFDEELESQTTARLSTPSADSGGRSGMIPLNGLSQGEARLIEASNEKLNLSELPAPTPPAPLVSRQGPPQTELSAEKGVLVPMHQRDPNLLRSPYKYKLKPAMLPTTRGAFYMPNFVPVVLVVIIVAAACLLVYRGLSAPPKEKVEAAAAATATASSQGNPYQISSSLTPLPGARLTPTATAGSRTNLAPPPFYSPDPSIQALEKPTTSAPATANNPPPAAGSGQGGGLSAPATTAQPQPAAPAPQPTTAPTQAPAPPPAPPATPTPLPAPIKVEISIGTVDARGSWIGIWVDDQQKVARVGKPGEVFIFEGRKIAVRAGNPGVIGITVNGERKEYVKPGSGIITHTWYADGRDTIEE